ncbi:hypothetical protein J2W55_000674 [Mucilaginibacter pocheonensis]|uniref:Uncharacterized protein n=1 Tax=Mucilaginibacter pocheonensis TaxID=398050 RepID=A0ABU1T7I8_9SPHI|nr:hypothetical protein [Mucilaginibacter pocheonensis]MDR6940846.1 hypothetical protein [Mucilaginibacter pocheonensis]
MSAVCFHDEINIQDSVGLFLIPAGNRHELSAGTNYTQRTLPDIAAEDINGEILDTYQLEIHSTDQYPSVFPWVFETGGKLPVNIDWHVYDDTGRCCIKVPPEEEVICKKGITLHAFIKDELTPYLFNQTFRRENGYYINERSHGVKGLIEYYCEKLKCNDLPTRLKLLPTYTKTLSQIELLCVFVAVKRNIVAVTGMRRR